MKKRIHLIKINFVHSGEVFWAEKVSNYVKVMLCGNALNEYYDVPEDVSEIDVVITDRPTRGAYKIKFELKLKTTSGYNIYRIFVEEERSYAIHRHLSNYIDQHNLQEKTLYAWVEY